MTAKIYLFRRRDGKVFTDARNALEAAGYKFEFREDGRIEAKRSDEVATCPFCAGTGSVPGVGLEGCFHVICSGCNGLGVY
jgi:hypothetical protein